MGLNDTQKIVVSHLNAKDTIIKNLVIRLSSKIELTF